MRKSAGQLDAASRGFEDHDVHLPLRADDLLKQVEMERNREVWEASLQQQEERWLADADGLLQCMRRMENLKNSEAYEDFALAVECLTAEPSWLCSNASIGSDHGGLGSDCASSIDQVSFTSGSEESLRWRSQSIRFLSWQQAQLGDDVSQRQAALKAAQHELQEAHAALQSEEIDLGRRTEVLLDAEAELLATEQRVFAEVQNRWQELDEAEAGVRASGRSIYQTSVDLEERQRGMHEAQQVFTTAAQQEEQLQAEAAYLSDQRQEVEAREAALQCMEAAWACAVRQSFVNMSSLHIMGRSLCRNSVEEDVLPRLREAMTDCIVDELLREDPRLCRERCIVWNVVHSSVGGPPLASLEDVAAEFPRHPTGEVQITGTQPMHRNAARSQNEARSALEAARWSVPRNHWESESISVSSTRLGEEEHEPVHHSSNGITRAGVAEDRKAEAEVDEVSEISEVLLPSKSQLVGLGSSVSLAQVEQEVRPDAQALSWAPDSALSTRLSPKITREPERGQSLSPVRLRQTFPAVLTPGVPTSYGLAAKFVNGTHARVTVPSLGSSVSAAAVDSSPSASTSPLLSAVASTSPLMSAVPSTSSARATVTTLLSASMPSTAGLSASVPSTTALSASVPRTTGFVASTPVATSARTTLSTAAVQVARDLSASTPSSMGLSASVPCTSSPSPAAAAALGAQHAVRRSLAPPGTPGLVQRVNSVTASTPQFVHIMQQSSIR